MTGETERSAMIKGLVTDFDRLVAFADAEDDFVLGAKLEDARLVFNMHFFGSIV